MEVAADLKKIKDEEERLKIRRKKIEDRTERLKSQIGNAMNLLETKKIHGDCCTISNTISDVVVEDSIEDVPLEYKRKKIEFKLEGKNLPNEVLNFINSQAENFKETEEIDKAKLKKILKTKIIKGVQGEKSNSGKVK